MAMSKDLEARIVRRLFAEAESLHWTQLPPAQRTDQYNRWVQEPEIGGRMQGFMTPEEARVWIKDGPMKEYSRAFYGVGKYSPFISNPAAGVGSLVRLALGADWEADLTTRQIKPLRLIARRGEEENHFTWGPARDLKHLVWRALTEEASRADGIPWVLCLVGSFENPIPPDEQAENLRLGKRCGLHVVHVAGS
jgi:hypothetical protein